MPRKPTVSQPALQGFTANDLKKANVARQKIAAADAGEGLIAKAAHLAQQRPWDQDNPRGLWYLLRDILHNKTDEISDAIDPTWQFLPSPSELQDDAGYAEINGHLTLIRYSLECWTKSLSTDKASESHFLLLQEPIAHQTGQQKQNWGNNDMGLFKAYTAFTNVFLRLDNGLATDRFGFFVTPTQNWVANRDWQEDPLHGWVAWLSKTDSGFQLFIFDPNYPATPGGIIHKSKILFAQKNFIKLCMQTWKSLHKDRLFYVGNKTGNPKGCCLQLCSSWLQQMLGGERWKSFPLSTSQILQTASRIEWSESGRKSRSLSVAFSRQDSSVGTRSSSPGVGPSQPLTHQQNRLNIVDTVGDISVDRANAEHDINPEYESHSELAAAKLQSNVSVVLPSMKPSEFLSAVQPDASLSAAETATVTISTPAARAQEKSSALTANSSSRYTEEEKALRKRAKKARKKARRAEREKERVAKRKEEGKGAEKGTKKRAWKGKERESGL